MTKRPKFGIHTESQQRPTPWDDHNVDRTCTGEVSDCRSDLQWLSLGILKAKSIGMNSFDMILEHLAELIDLGIFRYGVCLCLSHTQEPQYPIVTLFFLAIEWP